MELRHLRSFVYVAETKSFSTAATRCCVTQSAVSQHIRALEDELRCKLLIRTSHGIMLTESGEALLPRAKGNSEADRGLQRANQRPQQLHDRRIAHRRRLVYFSVCPHGSIDIHGEIPQRAYQCRFYQSLPS